MLPKNGNVENIKARLSITDVVSSYMKLEKAGMNYKAKCPFHNEKTPSFIVSPARGSFYCFGCGAKGDIFTFVERFEGVDFLGALKVLADRAGVTLEREDVHSREKKDEKEKLFSILERATAIFEKNLSSTPSVGAYLESRGISTKTISLFQIGYALPEWRNLSDQLLSENFSLETIESSGVAKRVQDGAERLYDRFRGRVMFPLFDASGRAIGFSGRLFPPDEARGKEMVGEAKYINSPETPLFHKSKFLYGLHFAKEGIRRLGFSMLVEGQMDLLHAHQAGYRNTVALSGTALSEEQVSLLKRFSEKLLLALDGDSAGQASAHKSAEISLSKGMEVKILSLLSGKDPADMLMENAEGFKECIRDAKHPVEFFLESAISLIPDERKRKKEGLRLVLPLLFAIQSPSDRAHFEGVVSKRLAISEEALK
ncbi:MAG: DNA primase, partial [Patescibacteria group bacterium]